MFGRERRRAAQARSAAFYNVQLEVDLILIHALSVAVQEHPEWIPTARTMLYR